MGIDKKNIEGYSDPTAYEALSLIESEERALRAVAKGYIPIAPHLLFPQFMDDNSPKERELGLFFGTALMSKCSEIWVFGSYYSTGMTAEIKRARWKNYRLRFFDEDCTEVSA